MPEITIKLFVTDDQAERFKDCDFMVVPGTPGELTQFAVALQNLHEVLDMQCRTLATLEQVQETKPASKKHIAKTLAMLGEPTRSAAKIMDQIRTFLGRSARVSKGPDKGRLQ